MNELNKPEYTPRLLPNQKGPKVSNTQAAPKIEDLQNKI